MLPPESSSTLSLNAVAVCPTMVPSNGLTSAYTSVTAGPTGSVALSPVDAASVVVSAASASDVPASDVAASDVAAFVVPLLPVAVFGDCKPHAVMENTIAAHTIADKTFFFIRNPPVIG